MKTIEQIAEQACPYKKHVLIGKIFINAFIAGDQRDRWVEIVEEKPETLPDLSIYNTKETTCVCADFITWDGECVRPNSFCEGRGFEERLGITHWQYFPTKSLPKP